MKSGFACIVGRPNVGKSTLLNSILKEHIAIVSNVAGTTRNTIQGVYNDSDAQIVFVDTPGIHKPIDKLGKHLNKQSYESLSDNDCILFLVDAKSGLGRGDLFIVEALKKIDTPVILVLNKIDKMTDEEIIKAINEYKDIYNFADIVPISALKNDNTERLIKVIKKYLSDDFKYYSDDTLTNVSLRFMAAEYVREKILNLTKDEVPHNITCLTTKFEEYDNIVNINVDIIVSRDSIKKIIIGSHGSMIKQIGQEARMDIEALIGRQIYLELYVKTINNWRDKERYLQEFINFEDL